MRRWLVAAATFGLVALPGVAGPEAAGAATPSDPSSLRFGGTGSGSIDRIVVPVEPTNAADLGATDFTIEFWMAGSNADNSSGNPCTGGISWINGRVIVDRDRFNSSGRDFGASLRGSDGALAFGVAGPGGDGTAVTICTSGVNLLNGAWHHVALQRSPNGLMQIWVDGVSRAIGNGPTGDVSYPGGAPSGQWDPYLVFGAEKHDAGAQYPSYRGLMDEIRLSNVWRYGANFGPPTAPFVPDGNSMAIYHLDGSPGAICSGVVPDATGKVNGQCRASSTFPRFDASTPAFGGSPPPPPPPPPPGNTSAFNPMNPARLTDTREDSNPGPLPAGGVLPIQVRGRFGIPQGARSATINLTAVSSAAWGWLAAYPCTKGWAGTSNLNHGPGQIIANQATVEIGSDGRICVLTLVAVDVVVDVLGWWGGSGRGYGPVNPTRLLDTRPALRPAGATTVVQVGGQSGAGIPNNATAASVNLTVTGPTGWGFLTAWPCDQPRPLASNLNYAPGQTIANLASIDLAANGTLCIYNQAPLFLIVDVTGWWGPNGLTFLNSNVPVRRVWDTRPGWLGAGQVLAVPMPYAFAVAVLNVTVDGPTQPGFLTAFPCGQAIPGTSNLNYVPGQVIAASVMVPPGPDGRVCIYVIGAAKVIVDVFGGLQAGGVTQQSLGGNLYALQWGYTQLGAPYAAINPYRFGDSRWGRPWECPPGWGGCAKVDMHGGTRVAETGQWVYDCSGFAVAAFERAGVDLVRLNAGWSDAMYRSLPRVSVTQLIPGDLVLFGSGSANDPTDHVGLYLGGDRMLNATTACGGWGGVCEKTVDWTRVVALARAPLPGTPGYRQSIDEGPVDPYAGYE